MVVATCLERCKYNSTTVYVLQDAHGNTQMMKADKLRLLMQRKEIFVNNLRLSRDNKIIKGKGALNSNMLKLVGHTPKYKLNYFQKNYVMKIGLVHFFTDKYIETVKKEGLRTNYEGITPFKGEENLIWFHIKYDNLELIVKEYLGRKAEHRTSDINQLCLAIWYPTYDETLSIRYRPSGRHFTLLNTFKSPAFVFNRDIPACRLKVQTYNDYIAEIRQLKSY